MLRLPVACLLVWVLGCGDNPSPPGPPASPPQRGFAPLHATIREAGAGLKELTEALVYTDPRGLVWTAPVGTLTDGASVPRVLLPATDGRFHERFLKAAIVHDAYCQDDNRALPSFRSRSWQETHRMFYDACLDGGTPQTQAWLMYAAVWLGGPRWRETRQVVDPEAELWDKALEDFGGARGSGPVIVTVVAPERSPIADEDALRRELDALEAALANKDRSIEDVDALEAWLRAREAALAEDE